MNTHFFPHLKNPKGPFLFGFSFTVYDLLGAMPVSYKH